MTKGISLSMEPIYDYTMCFHVTWKSKAPFTQRVRTGRLVSFSGKADRTNPFTPMYHLPPIQSGALKNKKNKRESVHFHQGGSDWRAVRCKQTTESVYTHWSIDQSRLGWVRSVQNSRGLWTDLCERDHKEQPVIFWCDMMHKKNT